MNDRADNPELLTADEMLRNGRIRHGETGAGRKVGVDDLREVIAGQCTDARAERISDGQEIAELLGLDPEHADRLGIR